MTDPITEAANGFDESAFDAELDSRWRDFRIRLADYLAELAVGNRFIVYDLVSEDDVAAAHAQASVTEDRLELVVETIRLADSASCRSARVEMLRSQGWEVHGDDTVVSGFDRRHVDAAAVAVEYAFRVVWDVPDPAYLTGDQDQAVRFFAP